MASQTDSSAEQPSSETRRVSSLGERTTLGKYQIQRELGSGGMGTVYLAVDTRLKRTVALKVLPKERTENETLVKRFESEALAAAQLKHENIVTIYDAGQIDGHLFIALEYVDGGDVFELVSKRGPMPLKRSIDLVRQVALALEHMHKRGLVHRDIKPSNLLLNKDKVVKLTDMGLARTVDESLQTGITREGTTVGTVDYMAPEQARNSQAADIRSDIYALGCTWYQMLTGEPPFPTGSTTNKLFAHISKPRPDPRELNSSLPDELVSVMHRMMARKPADRYQTPAELLKDLDDLAAGKSRLDEVLSGDVETAPEPSWSSKPTSPRVTPPRGTPPRGTPARGTPARGTPAALPKRRSPSQEGEDPYVAGAGPEKTSPSRIPERAPTAPTAPTARTRTRDGDGEESGHHSTVGRKSTASQAAAPRTREISDVPVRTPPRLRPPGSEGSDLAVDWSGLATKVAGLLGGVAALGLLIWLGMSFFGGGDNRNQHDLMRNPFQAQADAAKTDGPTQGDAPAEADVKKSQPTRPEKPVVVAKTNPPGEEKPAEISTVLGRPNERREFPAWLAEIWNPEAMSTSKVFGNLKVVTVGRIDSRPADVPSLAAAIEKLPDEGGVIVLRGPGPFITPPLRIGHRRQVVITGVAPKGVILDPNAQPETGRSPGENAAPLVAVVPSSGSKREEAAILATESSLTVYGVHLAVFSETFPADGAARLIDVRAGDLTLQKSSLTLLGRRGSPTVALSVSQSIAAGASEHPTRVLLDRAFVHGNDLAAVDLDAHSVDLLAINSLFVSGEAPVLTLRGSSGGEAAATDKATVRRILRLFSCTTCGSGTAVSLQSSSDRFTPPLTQFRVLDSVFAVVDRAKPVPMISLSGWPFLRKTPQRPASVENLKWWSESFAACGWENLVQADADTLFGTRDAGAWASFWGRPGSSVDYNPAPFPADDGITKADPSRFKLEALLHRRTVAEAELPGCDVGLLSVPSPEILRRRAEAFAHRLSVPAEFLDASLGDWTVRDVSLDNDKRPEWENLARTIGSVQWQSRTVFRVHGTGKKSCGPIHVVNKSLCIDFVDESPPLLTFEDPRAQLRGGQKAFITVEGGTLLIKHANFRVEPTTKRGAAWLIDVRNGGVAIQNSRIEGPTHDNPGYEGLIHLSTGGSFPSTESGSPDRLCSYIQSSFLSTPHQVLKTDLSRRDLIVENSVLAAEGTVFELHAGAESSTVPATIDLRSSTLAAGSDYFRFDPSKETATPERLRVFAENTIFGPPIHAGRNAPRGPELFGGIETSAIPKRVEWWDYACGYSNLVQLPASAAAKGPDALAPWKELAGPAHIVRSVDDANAVLFPRELPQSRDLVYGDFELKSEAAAARWSDIGTTIGATLKPPAPPAPKRPVVKETGTHKSNSSKPSKSTGPKKPASGGL